MRLAIIGHKLTIKMKERPILMSGPMVRAILEGRKTQTRRKITKNRPFPSGNEGDVLWVRETWRPTMHPFPIGPRWDYRATAEEDGVPLEGPWKPSIFMPREACRIRLMVEAVRIERLQDISVMDAIAEGIEYKNMYLSWNKVWRLYKDYSVKSGKMEDIFCLDNASDSYKTLWESINGKGSWDENPSVWLIKFRRLFEND